MAEPFSAEPYALSGPLLAKNKGPVAERQGRGVCFAEGHGQDEATGGAPGDEKVHVPASIPFILGTEFCERFCFYGMRAILALYLCHELKMSEKNATESVHLFMVAVYLSPFIGGWISDSFLGKFNTILYVSFIYALGNCLVAFSSTLTASNPHSALQAALLGLSLLALGAGGIKPCVSAFGGDQIELSNPPSQARDRILRSFFFYFYFCINIGAMLSTFSTPVMRANLGYTWAFATPAALMLLAVLLFWLGRTNYKHQPPGGNVAVEVARIMWSALSAKRDLAVQSAEPVHYSAPVGAEAQGSHAAVELLPGSAPSVTAGLLPGSGAEGEVSGGASAGGMRTGAAVKGTRRVKRVVLPPGTRPKPHWLDAGKKFYSEERVEDVKQLLKVLFVFSPVPIFWTLYDQLASRWVFQAERMDGRLPFGLQVYPDQMQTLNSLLVLVLIPTFDKIIYPAAERFGIALPPLRRVVIGMFFGALAFATSGLVEVFIEAAASAAPVPASAPSTSAWGGMQPHNHTDTPGATTLMVAAVDCAAPGARCISMLWQIPQFVLTTVGEILLSISGLEMAYSQAPATMASVVTAAWLATDGVGNLVTVFVVALIGDSLTQVHQYFFFTVLGLLAMVALQWIGSGFTYVQSCVDMSSLSTEEAEP